MKTKEELEEAIKDTITRCKEIIPACMACLDALWKQQVIDQKVYDQRLMEDTVGNLLGTRFKKYFLMDGDTMVNKRTGEVLNCEVDSAYYKDIF